MNGKDIEAVLQQEGVFVSTTVGVSMYPMLRDRRDTIIIRPCTGRLKKYDIPLYRCGEKYILHRIVKVEPDSYVICGDNCRNREYGVRDGQILGVLAGFYRGAKPVDMNGIGYRAYVRLWCAAYPLRYGYKSARILLGRLYRKIRKL